ncbi:uncharacterized protein LOC124812147 [Hydra vulgaris]|uniref:Uncharacterized protein LOC124812147 n=1 Tax=Hydra vulgaris TaxID=6087 RepID=A0ABM4BC41_HYDVU
MGCGSSSVKPSSVVPQIQINGNKTKSQIRGDRVSMIDARHKREEDSKARLSKLNEQFSYEVDKVAQSKYRVSSSSSGRNFSSSNDIGKSNELKYKTESNNTDGEDQKREVLSEIYLKNQADAIVKDVITKAKIKYNEELKSSRNNPLINISPATTTEASNIE